MNSYLTTSIIETRPSEQSLVFNNLNKNINVASFLYRNLNECLNDSLTIEDCFYFSIAFITHAGLNNLLMQLKELSDRGLRGKILTTDYLTFTEPSALEKILSLKNIELKMFKATKLRGFHTKGYIFKKGEITEIIIGSSNLTQNALFTNEEWNVQIRTSDNNSLYKQVRDEFLRLWNDPYSFYYKDIKENYLIDFNNYINERQRAQNNIRQVVDKKELEIKPNEMQRGFILNLKKLIENKEKRALLISATGTGKTYAIALALKELKAKRVLFLSHREQILKQALESFANIFKNKDNMGIVSGTSKEFDKDFIFATIQTMGSDENYLRYLTNPFEYIVIDETHHIGAQSYLKTLENLTPTIMLIGMSATPYRASDDFNIYEFYHHNIAYEITLRQAIEDDFLCNFHYFGIHEQNDNSLDVITNNSESSLHSLAQVKYILENVAYFGIQEKDKLHGLVFCNTNEEAEAWCYDFNNNGYRCLALSGSNSMDERQRAINQLSREDSTKLDFIFTVDIFNEGVDIPCVNEVVMLRPTQSAIIFTQQLGRGLRKHKNKAFCIVIDFIGNYQNNYLIPTALSGDKTYNKNKIRNVLLDENENFNTHFTIQIDRIAKERIYKSIENFVPQKTLLKENFIELKNKINKTPLFFDFIKNASLDPFLFFEKFKSNYEMLENFDKDFAKTHSLTSKEEAYISYIGFILDRSKRNLENEFLEFILNNPQSKDLVAEFKAKYHYEDKHLVSLINIFKASFFNIQNIRQAIKPLPIIDNISFGYQIHKDFLECLQSSNFRLYLDDLLSCNKQDYQDNYQNLYEDTPFVLYKSYKKIDVLKLLNWEKDLTSVIYGYGSHNNDLVIFVHYDKKNIENSNLKYQDKFINNKKLQWMSRNNQTSENKDVKKIIEVSSNNMNIHLFVSKEKNKGKGGTYHLYLGKIIATTDAKDVENGINQKGKSNKVALLDLVLKSAIPINIYEYLTM